MYVEKFIEESIGWFGMLAIDQSVRGKGFGVDLV